MSEEQKRVVMYFPKGTKDKETGEEITEKEVNGEGPKHLSVQTVRYWSRHTRELRGSQVTKAELFVAYNCLHYLGDNRFVCLPLNSEETITVKGKVLQKIPYRNDYNTSEYLIDQTSERLVEGKKVRTFRCYCQGWATKEKRGELVLEGANCSHVLALFYAFKLKKFVKKSLQVTLNRQT